MIVLFSIDVCLSVHFRCCTPFDCTFGYATYFLGKYEAR
jgi:hypothetical protein